MNEYWDEMGYSNRSEMLRMAFRTLKQVYGSSKRSDTSIGEKLANIEHKLEELYLDLKLTEKQEEMLESDLELELNFDMIAAELLEAIEDPKLFDGSVKDFVIIDFFKNKYSRGVIFHVLSELKKQGKLTLKEGVWRISV